MRMLHQGSGGPAFDAWRPGPGTLGGVMGRSHLLLGAAVYLAAWQHPVSTPWGLLGAPLLGGAQLAGLPGVVGLGTSLALASGSALAPDIDKGGSSIARAGGFTTAALAWGLEHTVHHRGPLHSLLALLGVVLAGNALGAWLGVTNLGSVVGFGWAAHLLGDVGTRRGLPLLWPLPLHVRPPVTFTTGTWQEALVLVGALLVCAAWVLQS
jgi:inner membrane protein